MTIFSLRSGLVSVAGIFFLSSCVMREFDASRGDSKRQASSINQKKSAPLSFGVRKLDELLKDLGEVTKSPPADYLLDTSKTTLALGTKSSSDGSGPDIMRFSSQYWNKYLIPQGREPLPLAAKTVLAALRDIRDRYWLFTPQKDERDKFDTLAVDEQNRIVAKPGSQENGCLDNAAQHWSDLQLHYFCALPRVVRACYRTLAPTLMQSNPSITVQANRAKALDVCLNPKPGDEGENVRRVGYGFTKELNEFYTTQWVKDSSGNKVNLFDYIMFAQTYAFDPEQEQAVLNTFYADLLDPKIKGEDQDDEEQQQQEE